MGKVKELLIFIRNAMAFTFSWLVICSVLFSLLTGNKSLSIAFLLKLFVLCLLAVVAFGLCFLTKKMQKKGFIFSLSVFYALIVPTEIVMFYLMGMFKDKGNILFWGIFATAVILSYIACLIIDRLIMRKRSDEYTKKILEYKEAK